MDKASEAILALKPVTFRYKSDRSRAHAAIWPDGRGSGQGESGPGGARQERRNLTRVRYDAVNAMLLNEFLKEHRKVEEQGSDDRAAERRQ